MKLYLFNPEHDIALAHGKPLFTAPRAGRQLRSDLGFLPALWATADDRVWVDDPSAAYEAVRRLAIDVPQGVFVDATALRRIASEVEAVRPWGWDAAVRHDLLRQGVPSKVMPSDATLDFIRTASHRKTSQSILHKLKSNLQTNSLIGESMQVKDEDGLQRQLQLWPSAVLKAPWSSSGRGVRMVNAPLNEAITHWAMGVIRKQGSLMVEPCYDKLVDFGMEFISDSLSVRYVGLSLFATQGTAYTGNILATEEEKRQKLSQYVPLSLVDTVRMAMKKELSRLFSGYYTGPLGVDMMVVRAADGSSLLHPCVEINVRMTMGHVALALSSKSLRGAMSVTYQAGHYLLRL